MTALAPTPYAGKGNLANGFARLSSSRAAALCTVVLIAGLLFVKIAFAAALPLSGDEALYWKYSKHLASGYIDHPPVNVVMIRLGTHIFGDTSIGVRIFPILTIIPASWAIWRAAELLFEEPGIGPAAALLFNLTLVGSVASIIATSDAYVVLFSALLLLALAKLNATQRGAWWIAVGIAFGLGMLSKYTTAFFAVSIFAWIILKPERRRWLLTPWPWLAGLIAVAIFSPVLIWNAEHQWASFGYQTHRMLGQKFATRYVPELIGSQILLATPAIFALGYIGLVWGGRKDGGTESSKTLLTALILPIPAYFLVHALHERVQGNWPEPIYPAFSVAAAVAVTQFSAAQNRIAQAARWLFIVAVPIGILIPAIGFTQATFHVLPLRKDPAGRVLAVGVPEIANEAERVRKAIRAPIILTSDYTTNAWLTYYLPQGTPIDQLNERIRWINQPAPAPEMFSGNILYVCKVGCPFVQSLKASYVTVDLIETISRKSGDNVIARYSLYRLAHPLKSVLDPIYPPMNLGGRDAQID